MKCYNIWKNYSTVYYYLLVQLQNDANKMIFSDFNNLVKNSVTKSNIFCRTFAESLIMLLTPFGANTT